MRESETVEYKEKWDDTSGLKALSAFANTRGGLLIVGVTDAYQLAGWKVSDRELERIASKINDVLRIHPQEIKRICLAAVDDLSDSNTINLVVKKIRDSSIHDIVNAEEIDEIMKLLH